MGISTATHLIHNIDLHSHSTLSDGLDTPDRVADQAKAGGVTVWALTDHDELRGLPTAEIAATRLGMRFINGVEISVTWSPSTRDTMTNIHVVGLQIDPHNTQLVQGLAGVRKGRDQRAMIMAEDLARVGVPDALAGARRFAANPDLLSRTHFARYLVSCGRVSSTAQAFTEYLTEGKPGYVRHRWAELRDAITWIRGSGGIAVLAHPGRYRLTAAEMDELYHEFLQHGGLGIEVITSSHDSDQTHRFADIARRYGFLASRGSDYHGQDETRFSLGKLPPLPEDLKPVWHDWF